jgi:hypothetical protein
MQEENIQEEMSCYQFKYNTIPINERPCKDCQKYKDFLNKTQPNLSNNDKK